MILCLLIDSICNCLFPSIERTKSGRSTCTYIFSIVFWLKVRGLLGAFVGMTGGTAKESVPGVGTPAQRTGLYTPPAVPAVGGRKVLSVELGLEIDS